MKKKGFTLIELLAVIVILAIIALISTPIIIGVIEKARKGAFEDSAYGVLDAGRIYFVGKLADDNKFAGSTFTFPEGGDLKISGEKPAGGTLSLDSSGKQALALYDKDKKWCALKDYEEEKITIKDYKEEECKIQKSIPATADACFDFDKSTKTITQYHFGESGCGTDVVIPGEIGGVTVEHIGNWAFSYSALRDENLRLTSIVWPNEIISIGDFAFSFNRLFETDTTLNLENLTHLKMIGSRAFDQIDQADVKNPTDIILPTTIETMGMAPFGHVCDKNPFIIRFKASGMSIDSYQALMNMSGYQMNGSSTTGGYNFMTMISTYCPPPV